MIKVLKNLFIWDRIIKFCLYSSILLVPILFLPWTNYQVAWNKQFLLIILVMLAFIAFLIKSIAKGEIVYTKSFLNIILLGLVVVTGVSAWLVESQSLGFLGATGAEVDSFLNMLVFALLFFLVANTIISEGWLVGLFLLSSAVVFLIGSMQLFGLWIFPWEFTKSITFNTIGTTNALAIFFGFIFVTVFSAVYSRFVIHGHENNKIKLVLLSVFLIALFVILGIIRFWVPFVGIALVTAILIYMEFKIKKSFPRSMILLYVILALSILIILSNFIPFLNFSFLPAFQLPLEVTPSWSSSWLIAEQTMKESWKHMLFGSGPATFQYQYGTYRLPSLNNSDFWSVRFVQGINAFMTNLVNIGIIGSVLFLSMLLFLLIETIKALHKGHRIVVGLGLIYLILMVFLYPQNFVLYFFIFVLAALLIKSEHRQRVISINNGPGKTFSFSLLLMVLIMLAVSVLYIQGQRYIGSIYFYSGLRSFNNNGDVEKTLPKFLSALNFDSRNDFYLQNLAQAYMIKVNSIVNEPTNNQEELQELQAQFSSNLAGAIQASNQAAEINPKESQNWLVLGKVYEDVIILVPGAAEKAIEAYNAALKLEPNNPAIVSAIGRSHLLFGDFYNRIDDRKNRDKEFSEAVSSLERAVSLKSDYLPAHFLLAQVYDRQGRDKQVIVETNELRQLAGNDPAVFYQLGLFHYRANRAEIAKNNFQQAIELFPNYSNARYFLGLIYEAQGQRNEAIEQFNKIAELNPGNDQVKEILNNLGVKKSSVKNDL
ncbi:MAG: tetratricopeptide repeat protein [Patescibacteria group bacterium]